MSNLKGWKTYPLEELASVNRGKFSARPRSDPRFFGGQIPFIQTGDVSSSNGKICSYSQTLNEDGLAVSRLFPAGTIVISITGSKFAEIGVLQIDAAFPDSVVGVIPKKGYEEVWLRHAIMLKQTQLHRSATKGAQPNINLQDIRPLSIEVPPPEERLGIVKILEIAESSQDSARVLLEMARKRRMALMQQLLTGKRRFPGFTKPWKKVAIGDVLKEFDRPIQMQDDELYHLASVRRNWGGLFEREQLLGRDIKTKNLREIKAGDFLIAHIQAAYGSLAMVPPSFDGHKVSNLYSCLRARDPKSFDLRFFGYLAQRPYMTYLCRTSSNGFFAERLRLNFMPELFMQQAIKIPTEIEEQRKVIAILELADEEITLLEKLLAAYQQQKRGLMQQLLTGKRRVKLPVASASNATVEGA